MNPGNNKLLIVFDATGCEPVSMVNATELAAVMQAGLQALYIEDNDLLNAVGLPFTREVSKHTATVSHIDSSLLLQRFRSDAQSIKKQFQDMAVTRSVAFSFSSVRGHKIQVVSEQNAEVNMVLIPAVYSARAGKHDYPFNNEVVMVYETISDTSDKALDIALLHAVKKNCRLYIILGDVHARRHVEGLTGSYNGNTVIQIANLSMIEESILYLYRHAPGLLVFARDSRLISDEKLLQRLINSLETDILLVS